MVTAAPRHRWEHQHGRWREEPLCMKLIHLSVAGLGNRLLGGAFMMGISLLENGRIIESHHSAPNCLKNVANVNLPKFSATKHEEVTCLPNWKNQLNKLLHYQLFIDKYTQGGNQTKFIIVFQESSCATPAVIRLEIVDRNDQAPRLASSS